VARRDGIVGFPLFLLRLAARVSAVRVCTASLWFVARCRGVEWFRRLGVDGMGGESVGGFARNCCSWLCRP